MAGAGAAFVLMTGAATAQTAVNPPLVVTPAGPEVGTVLLVHGGSWVGPYALGQQRLLTHPGQVFVDRGYRVISVDYAAGASGLASVQDAIGAALVDRGSGPLCLYGESAGGHLALVAAALQPAVDCVMAVGAPTDFDRWPAEALAGGPTGAQAIYDTVIVPTFGPAGPARDGFQPVLTAGAVRADVLLVREADDSLVPAAQIDDYVERSPTTRTVTLEAGAGASSPDAFLHGSLSPRGRDELEGALGSFVDQASRDHARRMAARATGCPVTSQRLRPAARTGTPAFLQSLRCLLAAGPGAPHALPRGGRTVRVRGHVTPARVAARLGAVRVGTGLRVTVAFGAPSTVTLTSGVPGR